MSELDALSRAIVKRGIEGASVATPPVDAFSHDLIQRALKSLPKEDIPVSSEGSAKTSTKTDWNAFKHAIDALLNGALSRENPSEAREKAIWAREHPEQAANASIAGQTILPVALSTGIGRFLRVGMELFGAPAVGEALTGGGENWIMRALSNAVSGAWQGALPSAIYPQQRDNLGENMLTGAATGGAFSVLGAPMRSAISPQMAETARNYMSQGMKLNTSQIPGASLASRVVGKLSGLNHQDLSGLTKRVMASMGSDEDVMSNDTIGRAFDDIGGRLDDAAAKVPNSIADRKLAQDFAGIAGDAHSALSATPDSYKRFSTVLNQIHSSAVSGQLNGRAYQKATQKASALGLASRDPIIGEFAQRTRSALDDALERNAPPGVSDDIALARNQYRNAILGSKIKNDETQMVDPNKLYSAVRAKAGYGGTGAASVAADNAGNPVDIGALAGGAKQFQGGLGVNPISAAGGGFGLAGLGMLAEHEGFPVTELMSSHPVAGPLGLGTLGGLYGAAGALQNTTLGRNLLLSGGPGFIGNPLIPAMAAARSTTKGLSPETAETEAYIRSAAGARGIDPDIAVKVARSEGLGGEYEGDQGSSFGPFQLHYGGVPGTSKGNAVPGLGDEFTKKTGLHASDPGTIRDQINFALDYAAKNGWSPWHGWKGDDMAGIPAPGAGGTSAGPETSPNAITIPLSPANVQANALTGGP